MSDLDTTINQVLNLLLPQIKKQKEASSKPIILGISGLQGSGKSTWANKIVSILSTTHALHTITISLDDLYKTHTDLLAQRDADPENKLYRTRGQPGTHDEALAKRFFQDLAAYDGTGELKIPTFDKSKFNGEGDRAPQSSWPKLTRKPDIVVFEGWCIGFVPLPPSALAQKHSLALSGQLPCNTPAQHSLPHLLTVNAHLQRYCESFMGPRHFDFFVHIDTRELRNVYTWRVQQEHGLIKERGEGMSDEQVGRFIDGYMPSYEVYLEGLRGGFLGEGGRMVRVVLDGGRGVEGVEVL